MDAQRAAALRFGPMKRLSRRHFLRGAGGAVIALPFLNAMAPSASAAPGPKRFIVFFTGLGTVKSRVRLALARLRKTMEDGL